MEFYYSHSASLKLTKRSSSFLANARIGYLGYGAKGWGREQLLMVVSSKWVRGTTVLNSHAKN